MGLSKTTIDDLASAQRKIEIFESCIGSTRGKGFEERFILATVDERATHPSEMCSLTADEAEQILEARLKEAREDFQKVEARAREELNE